MRFLVDNCLPRRMAAEPAESGHDAIHVGDLGLAAAIDTQIFERAAGDDRIIVSLDTDFATLLALRSVTKPSMVLFRAETRSVDALIPILLDVLTSVSTDLQDGAVVVIEDDRIRVRRLPIAGR